MHVNRTVQSLKIFCDESTPEALAIIKDALEATGKVIVLWERTDPSDVTRRFGQFLFNVELRTLQWKENNPAPITCRESQVLRLLLESAGRVVKRRFILTSLWGAENEYASRSLDIFIHRLRQKLRQDPAIRIHTIRGEGFMLTH